MSGMLRRANAEAIKQKNTSFCILTLESVVAIGVSDAGSFQLMRRSSRSTTAMFLSHSL